MLKRFLRYYKPHKKIFILDMLASLLVALLGIIYPVVTRTMLNDYIPNEKYNLIIISGIALLVLYFIRMLLNFFIQYKGHVMGVSMQAEMRSEMFAHLEKLPFGYFDGQETGKLMSRMTNDLMNVAELAHHGPENVIISAISIIIAFAYLSSINLWLTLIVFSCVPLLILVAVLLRKRMRDAFKKSREAVSEINEYSRKLQGALPSGRCIHTVCSSSHEPYKENRQG